MDISAWTATDAKRVFSETKRKVRSLIKEQPTVEEYPRSTVSGIYMLYVNHFSDRRVLPIYIGKGTSFLVLLRSRRFINMAITLTKPMILQARIDSLFLFSLLKTTS